jgi:hypothetical protein
MQKRIVIWLLGLALLSPCGIYASERDGYSLALHVGYGHNLTYGSMANFDMDAYMPINQHFEMNANIRTSTSNVHTLGIQLRPKFELPVGELFIEDRMMGRFVVRDNVNEFAHAISLGYRMQYVSAQFGLLSRVIVPTPYERNSDDSFISEPFNLLYRVEAFVRPETSCWNISLAISNVDNYMMERAWVPMLYLGGWYDLNDQWRLRLSGKYKHAGTFHMNAHYYAAEVRVGAEYRF